MTVAERVAPAANYKPELASLNMGSMNFGLYPLLNRYKTFKFDWEREHLKGPKILCFVTPSRISSMCWKLATATVPGLSSSVMISHTCIQPRSLC